MLGRGAEFWQYCDGKLQLWDAAMTVWEAGRRPLDDILVSRTLSCRNTKALVVVERFASAYAVSST
jgi:hypothetical protein